MCAGRGEREARRGKGRRGAFGAPHGARYALRKPYSRSDRGSSPQEGEKGLWGKRRLAAPGSLVTCRYRWSRRVRRPEQGRALDQALDPRYPFLDTPDPFLQPTETRLNRVDSHAQPPEHGQHLPGQRDTYSQDANQFRTHARSLAGGLGLAWLAHNPRRSPAHPATFAPLLAFEFGFLLLVLVPFRPGQLHDALPECIAGRLRLAFHLDLPAPRPGFAGIVL